MLLLLFGIIVAPVAKWPPMANVFHTTLPLATAVVSFCQDSKYLKAYSTLKTVAENDPALNEKALHPGVQLCWMWMCCFTAYLQLPGWRKRCHNMMSSMDGCCSIYIFIMLHYTSTYLKGMSIAGGSYFSGISCKLHLSQVRVPEMVIAGVQSAGKTTLIEGIIGFPVGYTDRAWVTKSREQCQQPVVVAFGKSRL